MALKRVDTYTLDITINTVDSECEVHLKDKMSVGRLQDMMEAIIQTYPQATSFVFSVVVHREIVEERAHEGNN